LLYRRKIWNHSFIHPCLFGALSLNLTQEFFEAHPKLQGSVRRHLEEGLMYQLGLYEDTQSRLDIIEELQGDAQTQALAQIQQARVRPLLGRGSISAETYRIYLPAQTRAQVSAAAFRQPGRSNTGRVHNPTACSSSSKTKMTKKNKSTTSK
jgi:hypothetical protein